MPGGPDSFQEPGPWFWRDVGIFRNPLSDRIGFAILADADFTCAIWRT
jgi:hypothetical protein